jgi:hypothetical protein
MLWETNPYVKPIVLGIVRSEKSMTFISKLSKVLDFLQNYLCDFHLWKI